MAADSTSYRLTLAAAQNPCPAFYADPNVCRNGSEICLTSEVRRHQHHPPSLPA